MTTDSEGRVDQGAAWVNEHLMPLISGLIKDAGGTLITQNVTGRMTMELGPGYKLDWVDSEFLVALSSPSARGVRTERARWKPG